MAAECSVTSLEKAIETILSNSFDADSKECLRTLIKLLDGVLQKPGDPKVRRINLGNAAFHRKVGSRKGGVEYLEACGFQRQTPPAPILGSSSSDAAVTGHLVLDEPSEDPKHLSNARKLLFMRAVQILGMKPEELPAYRPPPQLSTTVTTNAPRNTAFNPYVGFRHDGKSAAVGKHLGPDSNYVSPTETELKRLQDRQKKLESTITAVDREWVALRPNESLTPATAATRQTAAAAASTTNSRSGDGALLAAHMKKQQELANQRENGTFTTKAMRDLEKLKKAKVYRSCLVHFAFPDGHKIVGKFQPSETIRICKEQLQSACFVQQNNSSLIDFDLYVTPPRRLLPATATLQSEDLVPAAKIFVSFKNGSTPPAGTAYIRPELFQQHQAAAAAAASTASSFPTGQAVVAAPAKPAASSTPAAAAATQKKKPKRNKEDLLRRMMGK